MSMTRRARRTTLRGCLAVVAAAGGLMAMEVTAVAEDVAIYKVRAQVDSQLAAYAPAGTVSGRMTVAGSDTMRPVLAKLALEFQRRHPDIKIAIQGERNHGESTVLPLTESFLDGFANSRRGDGKTSGHFGSNDIQLLASSRPLREDEVRQFVARRGYEPTAIPIALDAVAIYVHRSNPLTGLTLEQADAIFSKTRKRGAQTDIRTWGQLGLTGELEHASIHLYGRDLRSSGTLPFFKQVVLLDGDFKQDVRMQPGSASVVLAVINDPSGIGYSGIGFLTSGIRILPLAKQEGAPFVLPSRDTVKSGAYPLVRPLYLYVNKAPEKALDPAIHEFLKFINSREGQETVSKARVFPLDVAQATANLRLLTGEGRVESAARDVGRPTFAN
jgi:phosphate transport system substrate-binding protein